MGYARLHFPNGGTVSLAAVTRDIVGVITGDYTDVNQLLTATKNLSEIRNTAGRGNWTRVYPATDTLQMPQVLSAPSLNGTTKYIQIGGFSNRQDGSSPGPIGFGTNNTGSTYFYQYQNSQSRGGIGMRNCTAAASNISVSNPTFINGNFTGATDTNGALYSNWITGNYIWISWSSRHCILIGNQTGTGVDALAATACFEHNEHSLADYRNAQTFVHVQWFGNSVDTATTLSLTLNKTSLFQVDHFNPTTTVTTGSYNLAANLHNTNKSPIISVDSNTYPGFHTKNSSGINALYLQPLFWHQHHIGVPHSYVSDLSKVYRTERGAGQPGDLLTVGADTYAYFPLTCNSYFALAVLRD